MERLVGFVFACQPVFKMALCAKTGLLMVKRSLDLDSGKGRELCSNNKEECSSLDSMTVI